MLRAFASVLTGDSLRVWVAQAYALEAIDEVALWLPGMNDHYVVRGATLAMLRLYRMGARTDGQVRYELDALRHLARKGVAVATPIARRDGDLLGHIDAPEGVRQAVLFTFAPGAEDIAREPEEARAYGAAMARIHAATSDFASEHERPALDAAQLVDASLEMILPRLSARPRDAADMQGLAELLRERFAELDDLTLDRGFCHGDLYGANVSKAEDGRLTFYDFDCCGPGWRAYDLAVFRWFSDLDGRSAALWPPFLDGYRSVRPFGDADVAAVPLFTATRAFWHLAQHIEHGPHWGFGWNVFSDHYLNGKLELLRGYARQLTDRSSRA